MIALEHRALPWVLQLLCAGAAVAAVAGLAGGRGSRIGALLGAWSTWAALAAAAWASSTIAQAGSFRSFDVGGWVGARLTGDLVPVPGGFLPLALEPATAPLLLVVTVAGAAVCSALAVPLFSARPSLPGGPVRSGMALVAAITIEAGVVAVVVVDDLASLVAAFALASAVATLAPLVAAPSLVEGRAVLRAFALHRLGDAALLLGCLALAASLGKDVWTSWNALHDGATGVEPWARVHGGLSGGMPHRTLWFVAGVGVAVAAATRLGPGTWPLQRDLTASNRIPPPLAGAVHGLGLAGAAVALLVRLHPVLALAPEAADGLVIVAAVTLVVVGALALAARDLLRLDALLLAGQGAVVGVLAGCGDLDGVVLGGALLVVAGVTLPWAAALVVEATGERDPVALGGLEAHLPRTHSTRLLTTAGLALPPWAGWVVIERSLEATVLSTRTPAAVVVAFAVGTVVLGIASWRVVHRVFNGPPAPRAGDRPLPEPGVVGQAGALLLAFVAPGLAWAALPRGLLRLLPEDLNYVPPLPAFCAPSWAATAAVRGLFAAPQVAPSLTPSQFVLVVLAGGFLPWCISWLFFRTARSGRRPPLRGLLEQKPLAAVAARLSSWAGRDVGVVRSVSEGVEALSRLLAVNFVPAVLDVILQRVPAFVAAAGAFVVRGTQTGVAPHGVVLALCVAAWLAWQALGSADGGGVP